MDKTINLTKKNREIAESILCRSDHLKILTVKANNIPLEVKIYLQSIYGLRPYLNVAETSIWLDIGVAKVYKMIKTGDIVANRLGGAKSNYKVDVDATRDKLNLNI